MDTEFTKGEWLLTEEPKSSGMCSTATGHFHIETDDVHKFIKIENEHREESKANAHLIAAAPDMYKLLSRLWELNCPQEYCTEDEYQALIEIEDLLAKARGE